MHDSFSHGSPKNIFRDIYLYILALFFSSLSLFAGGVSFWVETLTICMVFWFTLSCGPSRRKLRYRKLSGEPQTNSAKSLLVFLKESMFQRNCITRNEFSLVQFHNQFNMLVLLFFFWFLTLISWLGNSVNELLLNTVYNNVTLLFMLLPV